MPSLLEHLAARVGFWHASRVARRFQQAVSNPDAAQRIALNRALQLIATSAFGQRHGLTKVRTPAQLRRALPLQAYEDLRPAIDRVCDGDVSALFRPNQRIVMFATSSGTTALPKRIPVTPAFIDDYRRGWNTFGLKMLTDHPQAILRDILQSSGRYDAERTRSGVPCGAITGLLAKTQKRIVRRFYVGRPEIAALPDPHARYYTLMRLGITRDVAFAITANPATLIEMARTANQHADTLIRDVRDGTLRPPGFEHDAVCECIAHPLRPDRVRAATLESLIRSNGTLRPRDYWRIAFLACWTGGSMGQYLSRLSDWWGNVPVRDVGLLASEGRVSLPLEDGTPAGVLDVTAGVFEFIPAAQATDPDPPTLTMQELEVGHEYAVVLTNTAGLVRYRLDDVVRVRDFVGTTPAVEFLYRAGRTASVAGEKLTEQQVVAATRATCDALGVAEFDYLLAPVWSDPPYYRLSCAASPPEAFAPALDTALAKQNEEYESRRKSSRLGPLQVRTVPADAIRQMDARLSRARRATAEQYKRPSLFTTVGEDDQALGLQSPQINTPTT